MVKNFPIRLHHLYGLLTLIILSYSCNHGKDKRFEEEKLDESIFESQTIIGTITDKKLDEVSGLIASVKNPGYYWTHNDSGGKPWIYLIDTAGTIHFTVKLEAIKNRDWEDITMDKGNIYIGEIGDNDAKRKVYRIYQIVEPKMDSTSTYTVPRDSINKMKFMYENGPRDAETLIYDYSNDELVIITKRDKDAFVYSFPFKPGKELQTIAPSGTIPFTRFTAGNSKPNGEFVIKNYDYIVYWKGSNKSILTRLMNESPVRIPYNSEPQGEAITFTLDGDLITATEKVEGFDQNILRFRRK